MKQDQSILLEVAEAKVAELEIALSESVRLQSHYAKLLNVWDFGVRMQFKDAEAWIQRLRETGTIPSPSNQKEGK